ncbi:hypothetical protein KC669_04070, partial [Candidatus Dojkabacteria bacterium]|nr:hypothetical protein [Candidatus Dojkabacteria bacterium]
SNIKEKMSETQALFGGEISGHFYFKEDFFGHDDAIYAMLTLLSILEKSGKKIDDYYDELNRYITSPEIVINNSGYGHGRTLNETYEDIKNQLISKFPNSQKAEIDGIRLDMPDGMIVIRPSQTSPSIKIRFESKDKSIYDDMKQNLDSIHY